MSLADRVPLRRRVCITYPIEGLHRQLHNVTKNRSVFPNVHNALRLSTLVIRDIDRRNRSRNSVPDWTPIVNDVHLVLPD